jgi:nucleoporin NUP82
VSEQIRQLVPSPNGNLLAIVTSHTIHIAILPDSTHLTRAFAGPIRLKTHTLGPTTHVLSQSSITNALWHPLGVNGTSIVTVTKDAVVRVWLEKASIWEVGR